MAQLGSYAAYILIRLVICIVQMFPIETSARGCSFLATLFCNVLKIRKRVIDENLAHAYPEWTPEQRQALAWKMWEHLFLLVCEVALTARKFHAHNWHKFVHLGNESYFVEDLLGDRAIMMVTGHYGNFEQSCYVFALFGYRTYVVARPLDNPYLDRYLHQFRSSTGMQILSKQSDYDRILEVLDEGATVGILADQYAGTRGCWVDFFGRPASAHKAVALFCLNQDAILTVGCCRRLNKPLHYEIQLYGYADPRKIPSTNSKSVKDLTQWYTSCIEEIVREEPSQYWWLHRRWKDRREEHRQRRLAARASKAA